jgi:hypothetical protein
MQEGKMSSSALEAAGPMTLSQGESDELDASISSAANALCALQRPDGHFVFELEADATIPAEYVLMRHYRGEPVDAELEAKIARYLRRIQSADGGWPLFHDGASDVSASVKAYFALKMIGDSPDAPHMALARGLIRSKGGAANSNVFTRNLVALYGAVPWRAVPVMPVEIMLLPRWFPFHLDKVSYWARTVLVPLMVLNALKPQARNPKGVGIDELFVVPPDQVRDWPKGAHQTWPWPEVFGGIDRILRAIEPYMPRSARARAISLAEKFVTERLNGEDGLGAIFPGMVNSLLMFDAFGYGEDDWRVRTARAIASLACRPCGTHHSQSTSCSKSVALSARSAPWQAWNGSRPYRCSTRWETGLRNGPTFVPAAGPSNMPILTTPISTIRPSSPWRWIVQRPECRRARAANSPKRSTARGSGLWVCKAKMAALPPLTPTMNITT